MKDRRQLTEDQESYIKGHVEARRRSPSQTDCKRNLEGSWRLKNDAINPLKVIAALQSSIPHGLLQEHLAATSRFKDGTARGDPISILNW